MRHLSILLFFAGTLAITTTHAQTSCSPSWLATQRTITPTVSWEEFTDPLAKLYKSYYVQLPSDVTQNFYIPLSIGNRYTVLYYTESNALASGMEIYDPQGLRLEFEKVFGKMRNNAIKLTLEPVYSGTYTFAVRSIYPKDKTTCAVLLLRDWDDVEWEERLELLGLEE